MKIEYENIGHISKQRFFEVLCLENISEGRKEYYSRIYDDIIKNWENPTKWLEDRNSTIINKYSECGITNYFIIWALEKGIAFPNNYIIKIRTGNAKTILRGCLKDFNKLLITISMIREKYKQKHYSGRLYALVLKICLYNGKNSFKDITSEIILKNDELKIMDKEISATYRLLNLRYYMKYETKTAREIIYNNTNKNKVLNNFRVTSDMLLITEGFLHDLRNSYIGERMQKEKREHINIFYDWYRRFYKIEKINNIREFNNEDWQLYITYVSDEKNICDKTKATKLLTIVQFCEWLSIKNPFILEPNLYISKKDYSKLNKYNSDKNLAFYEEDSATKILHYLVNEFKPQNVYEAYYKEAIITSANSGMRRNELDSLELGSYLYDEDEKCYMIVNSSIDKLSQKNRRVYITKDGYEAIKRAEKIRIENGFLVERDGRKGEKPFIHLFEHLSSRILYSNSFSEFIEKIKNEVGIVNEDGKAIQSGLHGFRHFFAIALFRESNYNLSVVRYLLGHKSYNMTMKYLVQEKEKNTLEIREGLEKKQEVFTGMGINKIVEMIFSNRQSKQYLLNKKVMEASNNIYDLINMNAIKKMEIGYCIKPCESRKKCFGCNNFLISEQEKSKLLEYAKDLFNIISFKVFILKGKGNALKNNEIKEDILDLSVIISELQELNLSQDYINKFLIGEAYE
ncbi:tyrosine-type recombinase/integrase [Clostridium akagii]|uniref:tyrosine-type recombinase/integrase n=1 Tax=Clostridium akagii TaxID=91623 RepID=UPI00047EB1B8|nr:site-specific integrase [Clostridium akagii]